MSKTIAVLNQHESLEIIIEELQSEGYHLVSYEYASTLVSHIESDHVDMVILDIQLSVSDADSIFKELKEKQPHVIRVALSQYNDSQQVFKTIESNLARLFLYKQWDAIAVVQAINELFKIEDQLNDPSLISFINSIKTLPTVPYIYQQVSMMVEHDVEVEKIAGVIESDPAISSSILRVANSAFYGAKTGSIAQAIMFIGLSNVKNIILGHSTFMRLSGVHQLGMYWDHAVLSNRISHILYEYFHQRKLPLVNSSAGLLHNVGIILMLKKFGDDYHNLLRNYYEKQDCDLVQKERELFLIDHAALGAYLLNWWELPINIVEVAMNHHAPSAESIASKNIVAIVSLASQCAWFGLSNRNVNLLPTEERLFEYGLSRQRLLEILEVKLT